MKNRTVQLPLVDGVCAALCGPFPITQKMWDQMMVTLEAMKPGLINDVAEKAPSSLEPDTPLSVGPEFTGKRAS